MTFIPTETTLGEALGEDEGVASQKGCLLGLSCALVSLDLGADPHLPCGDAQQVGLCLQGGGRLR